jgi:hypothetical protein
LPPPVDGNIFSYAFLSFPWSRTVAESAEKEARKALNRLRRALEKSLRELGALEGAIRTAEGEDFPKEEYESTGERLRTVLDFLDEEGRRLESKILETGGLEPGRARRTS